MADLTCRERGDTGVTRVLTTNYLEGLPDLRGTGPLLQRHKGLCRVTVHVRGRVSSTGSLVVTHLVVDIVMCVRLLSV